MSITTDEKKRTYTTHFVFPSFSECSSDIDFHSKVLERLLSFVKANNISAESYRYDVKIALAMAQDIKNEYKTDCDECKNGCKNEDNSEKPDKLNTQQDDIDTAFQFLRYRWLWDNLTIDDETKVLYATRFKTTLVFIDDGLSKDYHKNIAKEIEQIQTDICNKRPKSDMLKSYMLYCGLENCQEYMSKKVESTATSGNLMKPSSATPKRISAKDCRVCGTCVESITVQKISEMTTGHKPR